MSLYDAPNQQVVRPDGSAPWEEGEGGSSLEPTPSKAKAKQAKLDEAETVVTPPGG
jgi:hypothetical protein